MRGYISRIAKSTVGWAYDIRYSDPVQRAAIDHVHDDLRIMDDRIHRYKSAPESVRHQARRELQLRVERANPGNTSPALIATLTILGTAITLVLTFVLGLLNGWFGLAAAATDPNTGQTHGVTSSQVTTMLGGTGKVILVAAAALVLLSWFVVSSARDRDRLRATYQVWLDAYTSIERNMEGSRAFLTTRFRARARGTFERLRGRGQARPERTSGEGREPASSPRSTGRSRRIRFGCQTYSFEASEQTSPM